MTPDISDLSPVTQDIDGIQLERGNPDLKSFIFHKIRFSYSYSNNKNFNVSSYIGYEHASNPIFSNYEYEGDYILRTYRNVGNYNLMNWNVSISWQPVPEWLNLSASVDYRHTYNRGLDFKHTLNSWGQNVDITMSHWNWSLNFGLYNPMKTLWGENVFRSEFYNNICMGYKWKNWKIEFHLMVPFGNYSRLEQIIADKVSQKTVMRSNKVQKMPLIRIAYNINWGRQKAEVQRKFGAGESASGASAASR